MFERLWNGPKIKLAPTDEELKVKVKEGLAQSPEEIEAERAAHLDALQQQPSIKLTPEELKAHEEVERLKQQRGEI